MTTTNANKPPNLPVSLVKKYTIIYWISTGVIALFELSGAFFMNSEMAKEGMRHLGLPE